MKTLRNELKYYIHKKDYEIITRVLSIALKKDKHTNRQGCYFIRSLYFDTLDNKSFHEKVDGVPFRKKYRLRIYDLNSEKVKFEIKSKVHDKVLKETAFISKEDSLEVIKGNYDVLLKYKDSVLNQIFIAFKKEKYKPVVIIDYMREAYVQDFNDIRITFDHLLSRDVSDLNLFKEKNNPKALLTDGSLIMEVKFNHFLPDWIKDLLQRISSTRSAISKFCISRLGDLG